MEFANIVSGFGKAKTRAQSEVNDEYDVRRTVIVKTDGRTPDFSEFEPDISVDAPSDRFVLSFADVESAEECAEALTGRIGIIYAECDTTVSICEDELPPEEDVSTTDYHSWGIEYMHADVLAKEVRKVQSEDDEIVVAVVDSGITPEHPIFEGRLTQCKDMTASEVGYLDEAGHGTNVAGIVADCTQGLNVKIMAVRVLDAEGGSSAAVASAGIEYAVSNGADVINASFVSKRCSMMFHDAQKFAEENGCIVIVSAGNYRIDMDEDDCCPSHIKDAITVTAINRDGTLYNNNCYGRLVDVVAPGIMITCASKTGGYMQNSGTSFAAPHVAAVAAMFNLLIPDATNKKIRNLVTGNTIDIGETGFDVYCGWGMPWLKNFSLDAAPKQPVEISVKTLPDKTTYIYKENIDYTGLSIEVKYDNGTTEVLNNLFTVDCPELEYGENTVTVSLGERSTEFTVEVKYSWWQWIIVILLFGWIWY